jgi:uracil-DNA glycosylase
MLTDFIKDNDKPEWKLLDRYHSLWSGNPDSKIMIVQLNPDRVELSWAINNSSHIGHVCKNPSGALLKRACERSGFHPVNDFFYCNLVPVTRIGEIQPDLNMIQEFLGVFESLIETIRPKIVIALGQRTLEGIVGKEISFMTYMGYLFDEVTFELEEFDLVPLQDPKIIDQEPALRNKSFFKGIRKLYIRTHNLR